MQCPKCQFENREGAKFCNECGHKFEVACLNCNAPNRVGSKFCDECGTKLALSSERPHKDLSVDLKAQKIQKYLPKGLTEKILSQKGQIEGERRQVTVMFCDMEGFTTVSEKLGAEEAYAMMDQVYEILIHKVHDYEGTVNEMTGDGIMALFGAPIAIEDAPQRAIRSSLAIHRELTKLNDKMKQKKEQTIPIKMRIGIHTGTVVVGTLGNDLRVEFKAVGDTVNLASRVEGLAEPGATYVTNDTFKLTEGLFRFEAIGEREIKGKEEPIKIYRVIAPRTARTRFDVSAERGLTPLEGRERELELLLDGFKRSKSGSGQAFSIMGEAGMGKSRLLYEFRKVVANENVTFLEGNCLSYNRSIAYYPMIGILKSYFDIYEGDQDHKIEEKVISGVKSISLDQSSTIPFLLELLSVQDSGIDKVSTSPQSRKREILDSIKSVLLKSAEIRSLIIAVENLHWIDQSSEDALKYLFENISGAPVLMVFTHRPEYVLTWGGRSYHSQMGLHKLSNRESILMVNSLLGTEVIDRGLEDLLLEKTEGVPFYIEEFVKYLQDLQIIEKSNGGYRLVKAIESVGIPAEIQDVLMTRLDALPEGAKGIAQAGSVIGREFSHGLISKETDLPERELLSRLSILKDSELVYERGIYPSVSYVFKHALVQDVAYQSLLTSARQRHHGKIAEVLEEHYPEKAEIHPELLGHHFTEAGLKEQAIPYWQKAGEIAIRRSANVEAIWHLSKGLNLLKILPKTSELIQQELNFQIAIGPPLVATRGWGNPEVEKAYHRALNLCERIGYSQQGFSVLRALWNYYNVRAEFQTSFGIAEELLRLAHQQSEASYLIGAHRALGSDRFFSGAFNKSLFHQKKVLALYEPKQHENLAFIYWTDPRVHCSSFVPVILWLLGFPEQALQRSHKALALAYDSSHSHTLAIALFMGLWPHFFRRDTHRTQKQAETLMEFSTEQNFPLWVGGGNFFRSWALAMEKQEEEAINHMRQAASTMFATGMKQLQQSFHAIVAEILGNLGKPEEGLHELTKALELANETGERWWEAEIYRLKGELLQALSVADQGEVETCFHQALDVARRQQAKSLELRASMSLSRLWQIQGKRTEARKLLAEIFGWFTEGFDTPDLQDAKALLEELS